MGQEHQAIVNDLQAKLAGVKRDQLDKLAREMEASATHRNPQVSVNLAVLKEKLANFSLELRTNKQGKGRQRYTGAQSQQGRSRPMP